MIEQSESGNNRVQVPITLPYLLMFLLLTFLCYEAHEMFHHLVGGVLCGGFGTMAFTTYVPKPECMMDDAVTLAGPFLSFAIAWLGGYWLTNRKYMLFAYTLIFASFAHLRFPLPLMGSGDEWLVVRTNLAQPNPYLVAGILFLLALPPLVAAYRSIANAWRVPVFISSWLLPFVILFSLPYMDTWFLGFESHQGQATLIGIPIIILAVNLIATLFFALGGTRTFRRTGQLN